MVQSPYTARIRVRHLPLVPAVRLAAPWAGWGILALWSFLPVVLALARVDDQLFYTGADGLIAADQLQYLAWIREAGSHGLIGNLFDVRPAKEVFLQPMFLLSGGLWAAGVPIQVALLAWKPVAAAAVVAGTWAYSRRLLPAGGWERSTALILALFFLPPVSVGLLWAGVGGEVAAAIGDVSISALSWGAAPTLIAIGAMPPFLLALERLVDDGRRAPGRGARWYAGWAAVFGATASWLHAWQGATLLLIVAGLVVTAEGGQRFHLARRAAIPVVATVAPIVYLMGLARIDPAWAIVRDQATQTHLPAAGIAIALAPIVLLGLPAILRRAPRDLQERALLVWPVAALVLHVLAQSAPQHALAGISVPLAVLAARGITRMRVPRPAVVAVLAVLTIPGAVYMADVMDDELRGGVGLHLVEDGEKLALDHIDSAEAPGTVLTNARMGAVVPAYTGRRTWVGHRGWSAGFSRRARVAELLVSGRLPAADARFLVTSTGAGFVVQGCDAPADLTRALGPLLRRRHRFGCATVYDVAVRRQAGAP